MYITGTGEFVGDVESAGPFVVGADADGIDQLETVALKSTSFSSVDCELNGREIKIYVELEVTTDFSWRMPVRACSAYTLYDMTQVMADQLQIDDTFVADWDAKFKVSKRTDDFENQKLSSNLLVLEIS